MKKIKVGISSCLLGNKVRYDGQSKLDHFLHDTLGQWCDFVPVCPEVECGLPIPRETMRLVGSVENPRLMTGKTGIDHTEKMQTWISCRLEELEKEDLVAFIFKTKSPSSGMRAVKVYKETGEPVSYKGVGLFAAAFMERFPHIPVEDEGRLNDPGIRENFIEAIFVLQRWRELVAPGGMKELVEFHSCHKYTLMAHNPSILKDLGKLCSGSDELSMEERKETYLARLLDILNVKKTVKKNYNTLMHIAGYFRKNLTEDERKELQEEMENYHTSATPLIVPVTLLRHYTRKYQEPYLLKQYFLNPHPVELGLLNHV